MAKKVTLYIEDTEIKLVVTKGKQVEKWASLLLESGLVSDGVIVDETQVADSIKALFKLQGVEAKKVIVGLSGLNSIFRVISVPELPQAIIPEAVMNEARRVLPVPLEQVYLSYQRIPSPAGEIRLFLVAYPRNSTDTLVGTLHKAGLKPHIMDLAPLALCRCADAPRAIIVNSWLTYLDIVVMADRIPQVIRSLSLPTEAISLEEKLPSIAEELNRTVAFYNSSHQDQPLDSSVPVFVSGDLAEAPDIWPSLVSELGYSVSVLTSPIQFPPVFNPSQFMVNIGLALKGQLPKGEETNFSMVDFNALPEVYRPPGISLVRILTPVAIVVAIGGLAYWGLVIRDISVQTKALNAQIDVQHAQMEASRSQATILRSQITSIQSEIAAQIEAVATLEEQISQQMEVNLQPIAAEITANSLEAKLASLGQRLDKIDNDLGEAVNLVPTTVTLLSIDYGGDSATINGVAPTEADIFIYARALRESGRFSSVTILSINETSIQEEEIRAFSFVFLLK